MRKINSFRTGTHTSIKSQSPALVTRNYFTKFNYQHVTCHSEWIPKTWKRIDVILGLHMLRCRHGTKRFAWPRQTWKIFEIVLMATRSGSVLIDFFGWTFILLALLLLEYGCVGPRLWHELCDGMPLLYTWFYRSNRVNKLSSRMAWHAIAINPGKFNRVRLSICFIHPLPLDFLLCNEKSRLKKNTVTLLPWMFFCRLTFRIQANEKREEWRKKRSKN